MQNAVQHEQQQPMQWRSDLDSESELQEQLSHQRVIVWGLEKAKEMVVETGVKVETVTESGQNDMDTHGQNG